MKLEEQLYDVKRVAIAGHVKPDGDCVGSTLAVYNYIRKYHPEMEVELQTFSNSLQMQIKLTALI